MLSDINNYRPASPLVDSVTFFGVLSQASVMVSLKLLSGHQHDHVCGYHLRQSHVHELRPHSGRHMPVHAVAVAVQVLPSI